MSCLLPSLMSEGGQWGLLVTASLEATGISCHTLAFGFKPAPFEVTFRAQTEDDEGRMTFGGQIKHFTHRQVKV